MHVQTVRGSIPPDEVKSTLIHEHLVFDLTPVRGDQDSKLCHDESLNKELDLLSGHGCNTIVEVSNRGMGQNAEALRNIAIEHNLHIIAATGYYKQEYYLAEVFEQTEQELQQRMMQDIQAGIGETDICAGIIAEIGSSLNKITDAEKKVFRAAAHAQLQTGAPLSTHCELGTMGSEQLELLTTCGVSPKSISFGHQDLNPDIKEQCELLESGAYLQFDTIGKVSYRTDEERAKQLYTLLDRGYEDQLMLSCDLTRQSHLLAAGGHGYVHLFTAFLPMLRALGVSESIIYKMLTLNPRRFLAFHPIV